MGGTTAGATRIAAVGVGGKLLDGGGEQAEYIADHEYDAGQHTPHEQATVAAAAHPLGFARQMLGLGPGGYQAAMLSASTVAAKLLAR